MDNAISNRIEFMGYDRNTLNSPQKQGISGSGDGVALSYDSGLYGVQFGIARADSYPLIRIRENGSWKPWKNIALKSDLTDIIKITQIVYPEKVTLNALSHTYVEIPFDSFSGYKYIGVVDAWSNNAYIITTNHYYVRDNKVAVHIVNVNKESATADVFSSILFIKN